jgi:beta-lactam-binding protein with PASTA domain
MRKDDPKIPDQGSDTSAKKSRLAALSVRVGDRRRPPSGLLMTFLFAASAVATLFAVHWAVSGFLHSRQIVVVPDLNGKTLEQALDILSPLDLALAKEAVQVDENSPPGAILAQAPPPGLRVREGKIVRVTLSSGGQVVFVPDLIHVSLTEAQNRLRAAGLSLGAVSQVYSLQNETGQVVDQTPAVSVVVRPKAMVDLKVSKGAPPEGVVLMPDFINQPLLSARPWAEERKISPEVKEERTDVFTPGNVIRQSPPPDSPVTEKTAISFVVAVGSYTVTDPTSTERR